MSTVLSYALTSGRGFDDSAETGSANKLEVLLGLLALRPSLYGDVLSSYQEQIEKTKTHWVRHKLSCFRQALLEKITRKKHSNNIDVAISELCFNAFCNSIWIEEADTFVHSVLFDVWKEHLQIQDWGDAIVFCVSRLKWLEMLIETAPLGQIKKLKSSIDFALFKGCQSGCTGGVKALIREGGNVNYLDTWKLSDSRGATCLLAALGNDAVQIDPNISWQFYKMERVEIVRALLEAGADPRVKGADGCDALALAKKLERTECEQVIYEWLARPAFKNS